MNMEALPPYLRDFRFQPEMLTTRAQPNVPLAPAISGPESALELLPSSALPSAQVFKAYPKIVTLENRTSHLLFKPDILTCYQQGSCKI